MFVVSRLYELDLHKVVVYLAIHAMMIVLVLGLIFVPYTQSSFGLISNVSEYFDERPNLYRAGDRIMEFVEDSNTPCTIPYIKIHETNLQKNPKINPNAIDNHFFIILSEHVSDSYHLLDIELPPGDGFHHKYQTYLYDQDNTWLTGQDVGLDSGSLRFVLETADQNLVIDEDKRLEEFIGETDTKFEAYSYIVKSGTYHINSLLYQSGLQSIKNNSCVIALDWNFVVNDDGTFLAETPQTRTGTLINTTHEFSLKQQEKLGLESWMVECKEGHLMLSQREHFFHESRWACVTPETKSKLIERGWNLAEPTQELTFFDKSQESEIGFIFENFMKKQDYNNVPSAFVIGKYNFKSTEDITHFCGEFKKVKVDYNRYFIGAFDSNGDIKWNGIAKNSNWCAINDDALMFSFTYDWEIDEKKMIEFFSSIPQVVEFYKKYDSDNSDVHVSVRDTHVSYFTENENNFNSRMNLYYNQNNENTHMRFYCFNNNSVQYEVAQEDVIHYLKKNDCASPNVKQNHDTTESKFDLESDSSLTSTPIVVIPLGAVIEGNEFLIPQEITVVLGKNNTITWINEDDTFHSFTSDIGGENSWWTGPLRPGESSSVTFNSTGVFDYHGIPGPWMTGKVIVLEK